MSIARVIEITAESKISFDDALQSAITRAEKTLRGIKSVWIKDKSVSIENGKISKFHMDLKMLFLLEDGLALETKDSKNNTKITADKPATKKK